MDKGWTTYVVRKVNARLSDFFAEKRTEAQALSPRAHELTDAVADLTMRGGKRIRPCAAYAGFRAVAGSRDDDRVWDAAAALELLQTYLLTQDDWMDGDEARRGGPSLHVMFSRAHGNAHLGAGLAMLAADIASGFAWDLVAGANFPSGRTREGVASFARMHLEVVCGQQLDLMAHADVALTHHLKSGSYTVRGPLLLGGILGGATQDQLAALTRFGQPVGVAFQLRDDLLGTFGNPEATGKPSGNDLRAGKLTSLVAAARKLLPASDFTPIERVLGNWNASEQQIEDARDALLSSGAHAEVEQRLHQLIEEARGALCDSGLDERGTSLLSDLLKRLSIRES